MMQIVLNENCLHVLRRMPDNSVTAIVTDPPYGLGFMGRGWDKVLPDPAIWGECLRVLKPGGHMVAFGAPRVYHRLAVDIEDQGFEIRDCLMWLYGSGFPKSLNVGKAIDKAAGAERPDAGPSPRAAQQTPKQGTASLGDFGGSGRLTAPATPEARHWDGFGTALKPAWEPILLARKPMGSTVAKCVQAHGTGALNIDACRIGERWPANLILDEEAGAALDEQTGTLKSGKYTAGAKAKSGGYSEGWAETTYRKSDGGSSGGASRFFYCAKASRSEREAGLEAFDVEHVDPTRAEGSAGRESPRAGAGRSGERKNAHPTVKPLALMRWLVRLVGGDGSGLIVDTFTGSGTTGAACAAEGRAFLGCELDARHAAVARARIEHHRAL